MKRISEGSVFLLPSTYKTELSRETLVLASVIIPPPGTIVCVPTRISVFEIALMVLLPTVARGRAARGSLSTFGDIVLYVREH